MVGDNVWLGGGVMVCPGGGIGENTVVGAGAVGIRDLPANVVAVATQPASSARCDRESSPGTMRGRDPIAGSNPNRITRGG